MKKIMAILAGAVLCLLSFVVMNAQAKGLSSLLERPNPKWSLEIGGGNAYGFDMKTYDTSQLDNSSVFTVRVGYSPLKYVEIQGEYSNLPGFKKEEENLNYKQADAFGFKTYTANLKLMLPIKKIGVVPYAVGGIGMSNMEYNWSKEAYLPSGALKSKQDTGISGSGICYKIGGGVDVSIFKNLFLFAELSHWKAEITVNHQGISITDTFQYSMATGGIGIKF